MTERVVVTGVAGFIGSHVAATLLDDGEVIGIDNFDPFYDRSMKEAALSTLSQSPRFRFVEGDIREATVVEGCLAGAHAVVHLAARAGVRASLADPATYASANVTGTAVVLQACGNADIRRLVFGSSSSVYGNETPLPFREDAVAVTPISPYAATKRAAELLCETFATTHGFRIACLRFFSVYGARQRPDMAIHKFTRLLSEGCPIDQYGDGSAERDHTHVGDIVEGVLGALAWTRSDPPACEIFNLGESQTVRLDRLISLIGEALGVRPVIRTLPAQPGDVRRTCADITKARSVLGYSPRMGIEDGIHQFVEWYRGWRGH